MRRHARTKIKNRKISDLQAKTEGKALDNIAPDLDKAEYLRLRLISPTEDNTGAKNYSERSAELHKNGAYATGVAFYERPNIDYPSKPEPANIPITVGDGASDKRYRHLNKIAQNTPKGEKIVPDEEVVFSEELEYSGSRKLHVDPVNAILNQAKHGVNGYGDTGLRKEVPAWACHNWELERESTDRLAEVEFPSYLQKEYRLEYAIGYIEHCLKSTMQKLELAKVFVLVDTGSFEVYVSEPNGSQISGYDGENWSADIYEV